MEKIFQMIPFINSAWQLAAFSVALLFSILAVALVYRSKSREPDPTVKMITGCIFAIALISIIAAIAPAFLVSVPTEPPPLASSDQYEDAALVASSLQSSLDTHSRKATIALQIRNKQSQDLFIARDTKDAIIATTNTGETINNQTCSLLNIRNIAFNNLRNQIDQEKYTAIAGKQKITVTVQCNLNLKNPKAVSNISITLPLVRIEGDEAKHFTISIPAIAIEK